MDLLLQQTGWATTDKLPCLATIGPKRFSQKYSAEMHSQAKHIIDMTTVRTVSTKHTIFIILLYVFNLPALREYLHTLCV